VSQKIIGRAKNCNSQFCTVSHCIQLRPDSEDGKSFTLS